MRFRKLRIAWSVACGIACVLLIVLWVRSYWWFDSAVGPISGTRFLVTSSGYGRLHARLDNRLNLSRDDGNWHFGHSSIAQFEKEDEEDLRRAGTRGPVIINRPARPIFGPRFDGFFVSHGFVVLFFVILGAVAAPCIKWRFSLRTLLIATTLVALLLGLAIYAARK